MAQKLMKGVFNTYFEFGKLSPWTICHSNIFEKMWQECYEASWCCGKSHGNLTSFQKRTRRLKFVVFDPTSRSSIKFPQFIGKASQTRGMNQKSLPLNFGQSAFQGTSLDRDSKLTSEMQAYCRLSIHLRLEFLVCTTKCPPTNNRI